MAASTISPHLASVCLAAVLAGDLCASCANASPRNTNAAVESVQTNPSDIAYASTARADDAVGDSPLPPSPKGGGNSKLSPCSSSFVPGVTPFLVIEAGGCISGCLTRVEIRSQGGYIMERRSGGVTQKREGKFSTEDISEFRQYMSRLRFEDLFVDFDISIAGQSPDRPTLTLVVRSPDACFVGSNDFDSAAPPSSDSALAMAVLARVGTDRCGC